MNPDFVVGMAAGGFVMLLIVAASCLFFDWVSRPEGE
jgi:hypothetical protein